VDDAAAVCVIECVGDQFGGLTKRESPGAESVAQRGTGHELTDDATRAIELAGVED
jgi:hypothetical protein